MQRYLGGVCQLLLDNLIEFVLIIDYVLRPADLFDNDIYNLVKYVLEELLKHVFLPSAVLLEVEFAKVYDIHLQLFVLKILAELFEAEYKVG